MSKVTRYLGYVIKIVCAKFLSFFITKKDIWLICEKKTEARDNGYHLYKYIRENSPEISIYYIISRDSNDLSKIQQFKKIIFNESLKHYIYYFVCKYDINSQPGGTAPVGIKLVEYYLKIKTNKNAKVVFLQHGIIKDTLPHSEFDFDKNPYDLFITAARREQQFIIDTYGYSNDNVKLTGLARYDNLLKSQIKVKNQILIMPTFRNWLSLKDKSKVANFEQKIKFEKSEYYSSYIKLLNSTRFRKILENNDYMAVFYPHYGLQSYINLFKENVSNTRVIIADRFTYDVQELLISSKLMITDFSSVFFDFAYMHKPVVYYQFDKKRFERDHYSKGYFDYVQDGFGPVVYDVEHLLDIVEYEFDNGMFVPEKFADRSNNFFAYHDTDNCKRIFEAISDL